MTRPDTTSSIRNALFDEMTAARDRHIDAAQDCIREADDLERRAKDLRAAADQHEDMATAYDAAFTRALVPTPSGGPT